MWAEVDSWVHDVAEAWPVLASIGGIAIWIVTWFARSKSNDREIVALTKALDTLVKTVASVEEKQSRIQNNLELAGQRINDACRDIGQLRDRQDKNTSNIDYILGRMDFGTRQRKDPK
jgi:septal ring factor EnvC (AmiA/AmiB activator)